MVTDEEEQALSGEVLETDEPEPLLALEKAVGDNAWRTLYVGDGDSHLQSWLDVLRGLSLAGDPDSGY